MTVRGRPVSGYDRGVYLRDRDVGVVTEPKSKEPDTPNGDQSGRKTSTFGKKGSGTKSISPTRKVPGT